MKKIIALLVCLLTLFVTTFFAGCNNVKISPENSYIISIYKENYRQENDGKVVFTGYSLKKAFNVAKGQMFEVKDIDIIEDEDGNQSFGKYEYTKYPSGWTLIDNKKVQVFPTRDETIFVRERSKKTINFYYEGTRLDSELPYADLELYNETFKKTYEESFSLPVYLLPTSSFSKSKQYTIELYTNKDFSGEPFAEGSLYYYSSSYYLSEWRCSCYFTLIKTTNVYIKISEKIA